MARNLFDVQEIFLGDGTLDIYSFDFKITKLTQLMVLILDDSGVEVEDSRVRGDDTTVILESVEFDGVNGGGEITLLDELPNGYSIVLLLADDEPVQESIFRDMASFTNIKFEMALDVLAGALQRVAFLAQRSPRLHDSINKNAAPFDMQFIPEAGRALIINDSNDGMTMGPDASEIADAAANAAIASAAATAAVAAAASQLSAQKSFAILNNQAATAIIDALTTLDSSLHRMVDFWYTILDNANVVIATGHVQFLYTGIWDKYELDEIPGVSSHGLTFTLDALPTTGQHLTVANTATGNKKLILRRTSFALND